MVAVRCDNQNRAGFVTLYSVIILGSIGLALVAVLATSSIWTIRSSGDDKNSAQARKAADSCIELALQAMHDDNNFNGNGNGSIGGATCTYTVTNTGGNNRTVTATGTAGTVVRRVSVSTSAFTPSLTRSSWQEVP